MFRLFFIKPFSGCGLENFDIQLTVFQKIRNLVYMVTVISRAPVFTDSLSAVHRGLKQN
jgi:septin family protein